MALESSRGELQLWFRPHSNRRLEPRDMSSRSLETPTRDSFGTPPWESREKEAFECSLHRELKFVASLTNGYKPPSTRTILQRIAELYRILEPLLTTFLCSLDIAISVTLDG